MCVAGPRTALYFIVHDIRLDHCMQSKEKACNHFLVFALKLVLLQPFQ